MSNEKSTKITFTSGGVTTVVAEVFDPVCDWCNELLEDESGGGLYHGSTALCPICWNKLAAEEENRTELTPCPPDVGLATWIKNTCW